MRLRDTPFQPSRINTTTANITNPTTQHLPIQTPRWPHFIHPTAFDSGPQFIFATPNTTSPGTRQTCVTPSAPSLVSHTSPTTSPLTVASKRTLSHPPISLLHQQPPAPTTPKKVERLTSPPQPLHHTTTATETQPTPSAPAAPKCTGTAPAPGGLPCRRRPVGTRSMCRRRC